MFKKIVSNLPFSPALLGQLGFYAKRLQKEQATRRLGLLFTALALIVQSFAMIAPPEPALASNPNNMIFNGINNKNELLQAWDRNTDGRNHSDVQQIFKYFLGQDFSRADLERTTAGKIGSRDKVDGGRLLSLGRTPQTTDPEQKAHKIRDANGNINTIWSRHLDAFDTGANQSGRGSIYDAYIGSFQGKWFAIILDCGNLVFPDTFQPPSITPILNVDATCRQISGYAYDQTNINRALKIYIYIEGPDGKEQFEVTANRSTPPANVEGNHGFSLEVPAKYHTGESYRFTVVALPAFSENQSTQMQGVIDTTDCYTPAPVASCDNLTLVRVEGSRTQFTATTNASVANGATISSYSYQVIDENNNVVNEITNNSSDTSSTSEITIEQAGNYLIRSSIDTSTGIVTSNDCQKNIDVAPPDRCPLNPDLTVEDPECRPCEGNPDLWVNDENCEAEIIQLKTVENLTQNIDNANGTTARPSDRLQYTLTARNNGSRTATVTLTENMADVLEYADLTDFGGEMADAYNEDTKTFTWREVSLAPGQEIQRTIVVAVKDVIPSTPQSVGNLESYDCKMGNAFGGSLTTVSVQCPPGKIVENTVEQLPKTGAGTNIIFGTALLMVVTYFFLRARQLRKEVKLIRKEYNHGTI